MASIYSAFLSTQDGLQLGALFIHTTVKPWRWYGNVIATADLGQTERVARRMLYRL